MSERDWLDWRDPYPVDEGDRLLLRRQWLTLPAWEGLVIVLLGWLLWAHMGLDIAVLVVNVGVVLATTVIGLERTSRRTWPGGLAGAAGGPLLPAAGVLVMAVSVVLAAWVAR